MPPPVSAFDGIVGREPYPVSDKAAELLRRFEAKNGSVFCRELKGRDTGVVLRPCRGCVEDAAELAEEIFEEK